MRFNKIILEDDTKEAILPLFTHRLPWLVLGLLGGVLTILFSSRFEELLVTNINLAFFIPVIVYMSDAVGTQTETIYIRKLAHNEVNFKKYLLKEFILGVLLGVLFGLLIGVFAYLIFDSVQTAFIVGLAMAANITLAPVIAMFVPTILKKDHHDPALGAGPFTTVIQDLISILIYFTIASIVMLEGARIL